MLRAGLRAGVRAVTRQAWGPELPPLAAELGLPRDVELVVPARGQVVYRLIGRRTAREFDFQSARERERPMRPGQSFLDHVGISVFGSEAAALAMATRFPKMVAWVYLSPGEGFSIARTLPDVAEHFSVWADRAALMRRVVDVSRVEGPG
jgi:hypothetical protein